ncbi:MAG: hypothetical protein Alpg2KO_00560 [Alphaproteobacteria bacterium]
MSDTLLTITGVTFPPGAARALKENLSPIQSGEVARDMSGNLVAIDLDGFDKMALNISAASQLCQPAWGGLKLGDQVTVTPATELTDVISTGQDNVTLSRDPVSGSVRAVTLDEDGCASPVSIDSVAGRVLTLTASATETVYIFWRASLTMLCTTPPPSNFSEWQAELGWSVGFEEV